MGKDDVGSAIRELEHARPYDFCSDMELAPAYYRGLAYMQNKQWPQAIAEFKRVTSQRTSLPGSPYLALSQLELGRTWQLSGNTIEARHAYEAVAEIWKSADPDFKPLQHLNKYRSELTIN
jgi:hypothetical protein